MARGQEPNAKQWIAQLRGLFRGIVKQHDPGALMAGELQDAQNARLLNGNLVNRGGQGGTFGTVSGSPIGIFDDWQGTVAVSPYPTATIQSDWRLLGSRGATSSAYQYLFWRSNSTTETFVTVIARNAGDVFFAVQNYPVDSSPAIYRARLSTGTITLVSYSEILDVGVTIPAGGINTRVAAGINGSTMYVGSTTNRIYSFPVTGGAPTLEGTLTAGDDPLFNPGIYVFGGTAYVFCVTKSFGNDEMYAYTLPTLTTAFTQTSIELYTSSPVTRFVEFGGSLYILSDRRYNVTLPLPSVVWKFTGAALTMHDFGTRVCQSIILHQGKFVAQVTPGLPTTLAVELWDASSAWPTSGAAANLLYFNEHFALQTVDGYAFGFFTTGSLTTPDNADRLQYTAGDVFSGFSSITLPSLGIDNSYLRTLM